MLYEVITPKSTVQYKIQEQTEIILKQNKYLEDNYNKLNDLYELKVLELEESKKDLKKAKRTNNIMLWVTIIACLAAVVSAVISSLIVITSYSIHYTKLYENNKNFIKYA